MEDFAKPFAVFSHTVDPAQHFIANVEVVSGKSEARHLNSFRRRNERLGDKQVRQVREAESFRRRELEAIAVIEWVIRERGEARVPHQVGEEGGIGDHRRAALIARAGAADPYDAIVVNPDGDRLRIAEAICRRVTARAIIVVIQPGDRVKKEKSSEVGQSVIDVMAYSLFQRRRDPAAEALPRERIFQLLKIGRAHVGFAFGAEHKQRAPYGHYKKNREFRCAYFHGDFFSCSLSRIYGTRGLSCPKIPSGLCSQIQSFNSQKPNPSVSFLHWSASPVKPAGGSGERASGTRYSTPTNSRRSPQGVGE